jgi:toxin HigB-1
MRIATQYITNLASEMIQTITHKGLRQFFEKGSGSKLPAEYLAKIALILDALDAVASEDDIKALGGGIHRLTGNYAGFWSIKVSSNYRIIFRYNKGDVFDVDYVDYH